MPVALRPQVVLKACRAALTASSTSSLDAPQTVTPAGRTALPNDGSTVVLFEGNQLEADSHSVEGGRTYIGLPRPLTKAPLMKSPVGTEKAALPGMRRIVETEEVGAMLSRE